MSLSEKAAAAYGNCPECKHLVRVPIDANPRSQVACPHCQAQFNLHLLLDLTVPELKIIKESGSKTIPPVPLVDRVLFSEEGDQRKKFVVPPQLVKGAKRKSRRSRNSSHQEERSSPAAKTFVDAISVDSSNETIDDSSPSNPGDNREELTNESDTNVVEVNAGPQSSRNVRNNQRRSRASKRGSRSSSRSRNSFDNIHDDSSPQLELVKMLFGGILAFPIAYAMLLWIFLQDPLGIAPSLGEVAPLSVPRKFRPEPEGMPMILQSPILDGDSEDFVSPLILPPE